jgi:hypothetical protein
MAKKKSKRGKLKIDKATMTFGAGAAVGITQAYLMREYVDQYGPIPFLGDFIPPPWNYWSTLGNIIVGGSLFGVSQFVKGIKGDMKGFLAVYGLTTLVGGVLNGVFPGPHTVRTRATRRLAPRPTLRARPQRRVQMKQPTPTGIPPTQILA